MPANRKAEVDAAVKDVDFSNNIPDRARYDARAKSLLDLMPSWPPGTVRT